MEPLQYRYSAAFSYQVAFTIFIILFAFPTGMIIENPGDRSIFIPVMCAGLAAMYYWYRKSYIHIINKDIALELDHEKLTYYTKNRTVYWKDVLNVYYDQDLRSNNYTISFSMTNPDEDMRLKTGIIGGRDKDILETILAYFEKYKQ